MALILAIVGAGPIGFFAGTRRRGLGVYLVLWALVFPIQTVVVFSTSDDGSDFLYWVFNALILCLGIGLNQYGAVLGASAGEARGGRRKGDRRMTGRLISGLGEEFGVRVSRAACWPPAGSSTPRKTTGRRQTDNGATVRTTGGRTLAYTDLGDRDGAPVFYFHGLPGSRLDFESELGREALAGSRARLIGSIGPDSAPLTTSRTGATKVGRGCRDGRQRARDRPVRRTGLLGRRAVRRGVCPCSGRPAHLRRDRSAASARPRPHTFAEAWPRRTRDDLNCPERDARHAPRGSTASCGTQIIRNARGADHEQPCHPARRRARRLERSVPNQQASNHR